MQNTYHDEDGDNDGNTFNSVYQKLSQYLTRSKVLEETESEGDDRSDREEDLG